MGVKGAEFCRGGARAGFGGPEVVGHEGLEDCRTAFYEASADRFALRGGAEVEQAGAEGGKTGALDGAFAGGGEELGRYAADDDLVEDCSGLAFEADGERPALANLVLYGAQGFIEGVDDEVAGAGAEGGAGPGGVRVEGEADGAGDVGGEGESCALWVEIDVEYQGAGPAVAVR